MSFPCRSDGVERLAVVPLKRLLDRHQLGALLESCANLDISPVTIGVADAQGEWLAVHPTMPHDGARIGGTPQTDQPLPDDQLLSVPILVDGEAYGFVLSSPPAEAISKVLRRVLEMLIQGALSQKSLAKETLDRYREINLLYRVHETIGSSLDLQQVVCRVLEESTRTIKAEGGSVLLADDLVDTLIATESVGLDVARAERHLINRALSDRVFETGKPRILNGLDKYVRPADPGEAQLVSLLCAPLRTTQQTVGVIALGRTLADTMFTAGDEKLLAALASQAGIAIANAREVEARERRLKDQIEALRIEIDEAKKEREVRTITESDYFARLQETARQMRAEFDI